MKKSTIGVLAGATLLGTMFVGVGTASATVAPNDPNCVPSPEVLAVDYQPEVQYVPAQPEVLAVPYQPATTRTEDVTGYKWVPKDKTSDGQTQWTDAPAANKDATKDWTVKGQTVTYVPEFHKGQHKTGTHTVVIDVPAVPAVEYKAAVPAVEYKAAVPAVEYQPEVKCDTNDVSVVNSWTYDPATGEVRGQVVNPDLNSTATPVFTAEYTFETDKSWDPKATGGIRKHQYTRSIVMKEVTATPIIGNGTGTVYGWNVVMGATTETVEANHYTSDSDAGPATYNVAQHHRVTVDLRQDGVEVLRTGIVGGEMNGVSIPPTAGSKFLTPLP